jgi:hypothetical protein
MQDGFEGVHADAVVVVREVMPLAIRTVTPPARPDPSFTVPLIDPVEAVRSTTSDSLRFVLRKTTFRTTVEKLPPPMVTVKTPGAGTPIIEKEPISLEFGVAGSSTVTDLVVRVVSPSDAVMGTPPNANPRESRTSPLIDPKLGDNKTLRSVIFCPEDKETVRFFAANPGDVTVTA